MSIGSRHGSFSDHGHPSVHSTVQHRRWHRNTARKQVFRHHEHEVPRRERRRQRGTSAPPFSVSTKGVHGMGITMWMNSQYHTLPQHLTHCPIGRQHNPCNFSKMRFFQELVWSKSGDSARSELFSTGGRTEVYGVQEQVHARLTQKVGRTRRDEVEVRSSRFTEFRVRLSR
jgi:hypothetical protein